MALIGNYSVLTKHAALMISGSAAADARSNTFGPGQCMRDARSFSKSANIPNGFLPPYAIWLPLDPGGISSYTTSRGAITATANLAGARNLVASATLAITKNDAQLDQIVSGAGSANLVMAKANAALVAAASASGSATLAISKNDALCGAIFSVTAAGTCAIAKDDTELTALAFMEAEAGGPTDLSPEGLASAVWNSLTADYPTAGTMGKKLGDLTGGGGGGGDCATSVELEAAKDEIITEIQNLTVDTPTTIQFTGRT